MGTGQGVNARLVPLGHLKVKACVPKQAGHCWCLPQQVSEVWFWQWVLEAQVALVGEVVLEAQVAMVGEVAEQEVCMLVAWVEWSGGGLHWVDAGALGRSVPEKGPTLWRRLVRC